MDVLTLLILLRLALGSKASRRYTKSLFLDSRSSLEEVPGLLHYCVDGN